MGELGRRIARIKLDPYLDTIIRVFPEIEHPDRLPAKLRCLLPDHDDSTPSFWLYEDHWHCYGCSRGGDAIDFVQSYHDLGVRKAVELVETALGIGLGQCQDLQALVLLARRKKDEKGRREWEATVREIEDAYTEVIRPYLLCRDTLIQDLAFHDSDYVFDELRLASWEPPARTKRRAREKARRLMAWALEWAQGTVRLVESATGKDRVTVLRQHRRS